MRTAREFRGSPRSRNRESGLGRDFRGRDAPGGAAPRAGAPTFAVPRSAPGAEGARRPAHAVAATPAERGAAEFSAPRVARANGGPEGKSRRAFPQVSLRINKLKSKCLLFLEANFIFGNPRTLPSRLRCRNFC
jgi:hypothetical protein